MSNAYASVDVCLTSQQMYGRVPDGQSDGFSAGHSSTPTGHVLGADAEQPAGLLCQNVLTVTQEGEITAIKRDVVRVTGGHTGACAQRLTAVPALLATNTVKVNNRVKVSMKHKLR